MNTTLENTINRVAIEAVADAKMEMLNGVKLNPATLRTLIEVAIDFFRVTFENANAEENFITFVKREIKKIDAEFYNFVYPPMFMDANGNYTTDSSRWV